MPTRDTTPEQQEDAKRLNAIYKDWKNKAPAGEPKRTQDTVAEVLKCSQSSVAQMLGGRMALNKERAAQFASLFECAVSDFSPSLAAEIGRLSGVSPHRLAAIAAGNFVESKVPVDPSEVFTDDVRGPYRLGAGGHKVFMTDAPRHGSKIEDALRVICSALSRIDGTESAEAGNALRLLAMTPDSERAFSAALQILAREPRGRTPDESSLPQAKSSSAIELRMQAMRLAEAHPSQQARALLTDFLGKLDLIMRDEAQRTESGGQTRHEPGIPTNSPR